MIGNSFPANGGGVSGDFLPLSGGTMTGNITVPSTFTMKSSSGTGLVIQSNAVYLDCNNSRVLLALPSEINVVGKRITSVADPKSNTDAVNLNYLLNSYKPTISVPTVSGLPSGVQPNMPSSGTGNIINNSSAGNTVGTYTIMANNPAYCIVKISITLTVSSIRFPFILQNGASTNADTGYLFDSSGTRVEYFNWSTNSAFVTSASMSGSSFLSGKTYYIVSVPILWVN